MEPTRRQTTDLERQLPDVWDVPIRRSPLAGKRGASPVRMKGTYDSEALRLPGDFERLGMCQSSLSRDAPTVRPSKCFAQRCPAHPGATKANLGRPPDRGRGHLHEIPHVVSTTLTGRQCGWDPRADTSSGSHHPGEVHREPWPPPILVEVETDQLDAEAQIVRPGLILSH
jgi:hypothetical protein